MRKVKITRTPGKGLGLPDYKEGQVVDVGNKEAEDLIKKGLAMDAAEAEKAEAETNAPLEGVPKDVDTKEPKRK